MDFSLSGLFNTVTNGITQVSNAVGAVVNVQAQLQNVRNQADMAAANMKAALNQGAANSIQQVPQPVYQAPLPAPQPVYAPQPQQTAAAGMSDTMKYALMGGGLLGLVLVLKMK